MTSREKKLCLFAGAIVAFLVLYTVVRKFVLVPAATADSLARTLSAKVDDLKAANARAAQYRRRLASFAERTYGTNELQVREKMRARITELAKRSGIITRANWDLSPAAGKRKRDAYREVGWSVAARGPLRSVVNFLYLLQADPLLHRVDALSLGPVPRSSDVGLTVRYSTIVLEGKHLPAAAAPATTRPQPELDGPGRAGYETIVLRDLLRPYRPRRPKPPPPKPAEAPEAPAVDPHASLRVVSLSQMSNLPDVGVRDTNTGEMTFYGVGEKLSGARIVMVDYRPMPRIDKPEILSGSRVIVKVGSKFWAVELGQTLADKHELSPEQLPANMPKQESTDAAPATQEASPDANDPTAAPHEHPQTVPRTEAREDREES